MFMNLKGITMMGLVILLKQLVAGIGLHLERWPVGNLSTEALGDLITRVETTQTELEQAEEAARVARESLEGSLRLEAMDSYRTGRDLAKALFKSNLEDFGLKPRAAPSASKRMPREPDGLHLGDRSERTAFDDWSPLPVRPIYEVFYSKNDPRSEEVFVALSTCRRASSPNMPIMFGCEPAGATARDRSVNR